MTSGSRTTNSKIMAVCLILAITMQMSVGSSIPIWEFLTRNQKISYLYSSFAQLVSVHCKATAAKTDIPVNQCKHDLLAYGYEKLQTFPNTQLDTLDPYQRHASSLIWTSIMRDHTSPTLITTRQPVPTPPASSIIILTHQKTNSEQGSSSTPLHNIDNAASSSTAYPVNPLFEGNSAEHKHQYAMDMDVAYGYGSSQSPSSHQTFLSGPHVVRVRPDGTPVEEDRLKPLPRDDDHLEAFQTSSEAKVGGKHHRRIASINSLKTQHLSGVFQQELQPPFEQPRLRRQPATTGYHYGKGQS